MFDDVGLCNGELLELHGSYMLFGPMGCKTSTYFHEGLFYEQHCVYPIPLHTCRLAIRKPLWIDRKSDDFDGLYKSKNTVKQLLFTLPWLVQIPHYRNSATISLYKRSGPDFPRPRQWCFRAGIPSTPERERAISVHRHMATWPLESWTLETSKWYDKTGRLLTSP